MTVRTWITVSIAVLVALSAAVLVQFLRPVPPPEIVVHAGTTRLIGELDVACWPQRSGKVRCTRPAHENAPAQTIGHNGSFRIVLASPAQPRDGWIHVTRTTGGKPVIATDEWKRTLRYDLVPGRYVLTAQAGRTGKGNSYVRYVFALNVTRSGN